MDNYVQVIIYRKGKPRMLLYLYGAISQICSDGVFSKCTPIFVSALEKKYTKFYRLDKNGEPAEIDLNSYGKPVFLPASRKKVNDGKEYFIVYRSTQNHTKRQYATYFEPIRIPISAGGELYWLPSSLSMGIRFPDQFVVVLAPEISEDKLANM